MACTLALLTGCNAADATAPADSPLIPPPDVSLGNALVGSAVSTPVQVSVVRKDGRPASNVAVRWTTESGSVTRADAITNAAGIATAFWTLGTVAGPQRLVAKVDGLDPVVFGVDAIADRAARILVATEPVTLSLLGDTARIDARAVDRFGNAVGAQLQYALDPGSNAVELLGYTPAVVARHRGIGTLRITADTARTQLTISVDPAAPRPMRVVGDTIRPGVPFAIDGESFALLPAAVSVDINGVPATVLAVTRNRIEAVLPINSVPCQATAHAQLRVTIAGARGETSAPLRVATRLDLARGQSASLLNAQDVRCAELVAPAGGANARFMVAVINTSQAASTTSSFELRGTGAGAMAGRVAVNLDPAAAVINANAALPPGLAAFEKSQGAHGVQLEKQRDLFRRSGSPMATWQNRRASNAGVAASVMPRSEGDIVTVKALYNSCTSGRDVQARVVYAGSRGVVLEDIAAPRAGTMDAEFKAIGQEFDAVQYPLLVENIGDPLAMNTAMGGDGRVTMLFTRYVNDSVPGIAGYVTACNFYPKTTFAASNEDEIFYARVANAQESPSEWRRAMRSTVIHEAKHIASFAERLSRGHPFEESWLEESTARIAEELYSRRFAGGGSWKGNTGFQSSVRCEVNQCDDRPLMMWRHFATLHSFRRNVDELTPIGAAASGDFTFYASGWSLVRWAADHYALNEGQWLRDLVRGGQATGLANLEQRTGRPAGEMLSDWALASAVDGVDGFTPQRAQVTLPSWNTSDIMRGLSQTYPGAYVASPLKVRNYSFGQFALPVERLRAFSSSYFSFAGSESGSQVIELRGQGGAATPGNLRIAVIRVE